MGQKWDFLWMGLKEEFLTEVGLEYHNPIGWAYLTGFGETNTVTP